MYQITVKKKQLEREGKECLWERVWPRDLRDKKERKNRELQGNGFMHKLGN
jgi:hypothetical protein